MFALEAKAVNVRDDSRLEQYLHPSFCFYWAIMKRCRDKCGPAVVKTTDATLMQLQRGRLDPFMYRRCFGSVGHVIRIQRRSQTHVFHTQEKGPSNFGAVDVSSRRAWLCCVGKS